MNSEELAFCTTIELGVTLVMKPSDVNATPSQVNTTVIDEDSVCHFLSNPSASSRDTVMFLLTARALSIHAARWAAESLHWNLDELLSANGQNSQSDVKP